MAQSSFSEMEFNNSHEVPTRDGETITWNNGICIIGWVVVTVCLRAPLFDGAATGRCSTLLSVHCHSRH